MISRPIEDRALLNIYLQARALEHLDEYRSRCHRGNTRRSRIRADVPSAITHTSPGGRCIDGSANAWASYAEVDSAPREGAAPMT